MSQEDREAGPLAQFLAEDHRRLDALLQSAATQPAQVNREVYDQFRAGLLRHIGMEEKILFPAVRRWRGGTPLPIAAKLRLDHGALLKDLRAAPSVAVMPHSDRPAVMTTLRRTLERAGYRMDADIDRDVPVTPARES